MREPLRGALWFLSGPDFLILNFFLSRKRTRGCNKSRDKCNKSLHDVQCFC